MIVSAAELHLRRLVDEAPPGSSDDHVPAAVTAARALVAVGALSSEVALNLLDEHDYERDPIEASAPGPASFEPRRVVACEAELTPSFGSLQLRYIIFGRERTELAVVGTVEHAALDVNNSLRVGDDAGTTLTAYFAGRWRAGELRGAFVSFQGALSPATRWVDIDDHRVALGPDVVPPAVRVEALAEHTPALRHLWQVVTPHEWTDAPASLEPAVEALVAVGAVAPDHPDLAVIREVNAVMARTAVATREPPEPWRSLRDSDNDALDGPEVLVVIGAITPVFDRYGVAIDALESTREDWALTVRIAPDDAIWTHGLDDPLQPPLRWWARDDRGNTYLGLRGSWTGGGAYGEGDIYFEAPLDPEAAFVDLMPTGPEHRAVIRVPLSVA